MAETDVLLVGAGPVGSVAAIELVRRGVRCRLVDALPEPPRYAKAVGIQPRTLEVFESMGLLREFLDASVQLRGQLTYVNGAPAGRLELALPPEVPFGFVGLPQYETERILAERLAAMATRVERGTTLVGFTQDQDGVDAVLRGPGGEQAVRARYLVGCDGAHSTVRKTLGLTFEGAAFTEQYMLGDVELDWSQPPGYGVRATHQTDGVTDDGLVCIPLPGHHRYRVSMQVPPELAVAAGPDGIEHGFRSGPGPDLADIQAVLDRLSPEPVTASRLRWSSAFRISHRIVDSYSRGRVFVAGDAAHIHPPTGAQGMNTGIQDAHNLAWKLALAVAGEGSADLLASYDAERRPVGEEVVGRTVRHAKDGFGNDDADPERFLLREAQLLIDYRDSPVVTASPSGTRMPPAGTRAPDARGLTRAAVAFPFRLFTLFTGTGHTALVYLDSTAEIADLERTLERLRTEAGGHLDSYLIVAPDTEPVPTVPPLVCDRDGDFAHRYRPEPGTLFLVRPDGYLGYVGSPTDPALARHLTATFATARTTG
ncbi:3-(3-hydroxyphenyl)propionate hydroxylase [Nocardia neocaledoniensis NBRC 108232]|uniref:Pentachlorophenol monooxygenase n=1 Tax=Nocardia neocaledoniensis TaxID=236511 RepID=A0A317N8R5_9NOCA|nr:FAD-dependent monooxygenase [Nocardia neocaledoniensis]PWV71706.1 pentachlorophenol monooxygenase [Nocardia neocaledoniensis]GEM30872.1 3-(3-hydroxyphenyl)propionate hydroxylase [Nocardia neocaledoniensis NBRC 108232]